MPSYNNHIIDSETICEELSNNYEKNEIFGVYYRHRLYQIQEALEDASLNDILLVVKRDMVTELMGHYQKMAFASPERVAFLNHLIAILFLRQLKEKYSIETAHAGLLDEEESYLRDKSYDDYSLVESELATREDVFRAIEGLNMKDTRLHIVLEYDYEIEYEISNYLQEEYPFITMVYSEGGISGLSLNPAGGRRMSDYIPHMYVRFTRYGIEEDTYPKAKAAKIKNEKRKQRKTPRTIS